ncbi:MAG: ATPase [Candidatus Eisenbacteria sp.]|nr:ATPase [Candidatus Eisenbacteria bacterium]
MGRAALYCGIDVGAAATKVIVIDRAGEIRARRVGRTGAGPARIAQRYRDEILTELDLELADISRTCATGYARRDVAFADCSRTEISCHSRGCLHFFSGPLTVVDIGGQDNKIIRLDEHGKRVGFKLNRKCAAGTGAFLEEIATLLEVPLEEMNGVAQQAVAPVVLGSFCTVFTKTEILTNFRRGDRIPDIAAGAFESVVRRITEMDPLEGEILLTGGVVAHNPVIVSIFERRLARPVKVPPEPQFTGALGAALVAQSEDEQEA